MAKKLTLPDGSSVSPLSSPSSFPTSPLLNKLPDYSSAERILSDSEVWKVLDGDNSITEPGLLLGSSSIEEEMTWLENELEALNSSSFSSDFITGDLASGTSDNMDLFEADPLQFESRRTYDRCQMKMKPMQECHTTPKPRTIGRSSAYIHDPSSGLDEATHMNEEPQGSLRVWHFLGRTNKTRQLMGTVHGSDPMDVLSHPSYDSSSDLTSSCVHGFHLTDDRTTKARAIHFGQGPPSATSSSSGFVPSVTNHLPSTTKDFPERREAYPNPPVVRATSIGIQSLTAATTHPRSEVDLSQSLPIPEAKCSADAAACLPPADTITPHRIGATGKLLNTQIAAEISSAILSETNDATGVKRKNRLPAIYARDSPKPMPTLPLPAVTAVTPAVTTHTDVLPKYATANTSREKVTDSLIRRLPMVPPRSATLNFESRQSSLQVDAPFPVPPHTSVHMVRRSNSNILGPQALMTPRFTRTASRVDNTTPANPNPPTSVIQVISSNRPPPCPAGPRNPHRRSDITPIKPAGKGEKNTPGTGARSVSIPRVPPCH